MSKKRQVNSELINRVRKAEKIILACMAENSSTTPELCMPELVKHDVYKYDSKGRGHHFREDLRTLRDNNMLETTFEKIKVKQSKPGAHWYIEI